MGVMPGRRPDRPKDREMIDAWLADRWPAVFSSVYIPIDAAFFQVVRGEAAAANLPHWAQGLLSARMTGRNTHFKTLQVMAAVGNYWHDLYGGIVRPIDEAEREWAGAELARLREERR